MTDLMTVEEVAEHTRLSAYTIRSAVRSGELAGSKIRGRIRIHPDDLAAWIDDNRVRPAAERFDDRTRTPARPRPKPPTSSARDALRAVRREAA